jgi:hypothetical protein
LGILQTRYDIKKLATLIMYNLAMSLENGVEVQLNAITFLTIKLVQFFDLKTTVRMLGLFY